ncbi:hypothetical protein LUZ60_010751 [Juncus effusus]|nr:hypothetical protein LUZ60_010751 [Juncus effusus]
MPRSIEFTNSNSKSNSNSKENLAIKVGSTGTVASLMSRELDTMKISQIAPQDASSSSSNTNPRRKKNQSNPISVPCGANPKKIVSPKKKNSSNGDDDKLPKRNVRKSRYDAPILRGDFVGTDRNPNSNPKIGYGVKKGNLNFVEVVDLKCNNPMSSRLRKLGFSKLSESIA